LGVRHCREIEHALTVRIIPDGSVALTVAKVEAMLADEVGSTVSSLASSLLGVRRVPVPGRGNRAGGALVPPLRNPAVGCGDRPGLARIPPGISSGEPHHARRARVGRSVGGDGQVGRALLQAVSMLDDAECETAERAAVVVGVGVAGGVPAAAGGAGAGRWVFGRVVRRIKATGAASRTTFRDRGAGRRPPGSAGSPRRCGCASLRPGSRPRPPSPGSPVSSPVWSIRPPLRRPRSPVVLAAGCPGSADAPVGGWPPRSTSWTRCSTGRHG